MSMAVFFHMGYILWEWLHQINWQLQLDPSFFWGWRCTDPPFFCITARTAVSKTSFSPSRVNALHSTYLHFSSFSMTALAVSLVMGAVLGSLALRVACSRRSTLLPTKILMAAGTTASISGYH